MLDTDKDTPMGGAGAAEADAAETVAALALSDDEQRVLELYDRLRALQLDIALLRAADSHDRNHDNPPLHPPSSVDLGPARQTLLEARAAYVLRNEAVDGVLTVHPILKAVHNATDASPIERDLLPAVTARDAVSQAVARQATTRRAVRDDRAAVAAESRRVGQQNAALAAQVRQLVARGKAAAAMDEDDDDDDDGNTARQLQSLEAAVKASHQRWKLIKGTASAIVAGSGIDWARDAVLRDVVLDPE